jgi:hypothetical protein
VKPLLPALLAHYYTHIDGELVDDQDDAYLRELIDQWHDTNGQ